MSAPGLLAELDQRQLGLPYSAAYSHSFGSAFNDIKRHRPSFGFPKLTAELEYLGSAFNKIKLHRSSFGFPKLTAEFEYIGSAFNEPKFEYVVLPLVYTILSCPDHRLSYGLRRPVGDRSKCGFLSSESQSGLRLGQGASVLHL